MDLMINDMSSLLGFIKSGRVRALAVSSLKRNATLPELPTISEAGLPGYDATAWYGLLAPAGTPRAIVTKLNGEVKQILRTPKMQERLGAHGFDIVCAGHGALLHR